MTHVVVIGLGSIGRRHATNIAALRPDARFTIVRREAVVDGFCESLGAPVVTDLDDVDDRVDLAVLATPSAEHVATLPALLDRGWPLLVEKPVVSEARDCDAIAAGLEAATAQVRVAGFNLRHLSSLRRMRAVIEAGDIGTPVRASLTAGQWLPDWRPGVDYRTVYSADAARGGGVELDLSHEFDVARWLFGDLDLEFARGGHFSTLEISANDTAVSVLGPVAGVGPLTTITLDYVTRPRVRVYEVVGDRGRLVWNIEGTLDLTTSEGRHVLTTDPADFDVATTYVTMVEETLSAVATGELGAVQTLADGLASTRLAIRARDEGRR